MAGTDQIDGGATTVEPSEFEVRDRRYWAAVIDVYVLGLVLGVGVHPLVASSPHTAAMGALIAFPILVATEARDGRTPGKAVTGLRTQRFGGGPVGWRAAAKRRAWMALPVVGFLPAVSPVTGEFLLSFVVVALALSGGRSSDGRFWHDRQAGTEVIADDDARASRPMIALGVVAALVVVAVGWWFQPSP